MAARIVEHLHGGEDHSPVACLDHVPHTTRPFVVQLLDICPSLSLVGAPHGIGGKNSTGSIVQLIVPGPISLIQVHERRDDGPGLGAKQLPLVAYGDVDVLAEQRSWLRPGLALIRAHQCGRRVESQNASVGRMNEGT